MSRSVIAKRTIAVDIDDVLAAHIPEFIKFSNEQYGTNLTVHDYNGDWPTLWGLSLEETLVRARRFHEETVSSYESIEDALPVLRRLAERYTLVVVTARQSYNIDATHEWINTHFNSVFSETHFVPIWEPNNKITKADICQQIGADYLIDDQPLHCNIATEAGITSLLFGEYEWAKRESVHSDVVLVKDWHAVEAFFRNPKKSLA